MKSHTILYVKDQRLATEFYTFALALEPILNVPGMTEFSLNDGSILGLMPEGGIKRLLGDRIPDPAQASGIPRAELYLRVDQPEVFHGRAIEHGARELSPVDRRDWGDIAGYSIDRDGHVLAFAKALPRPISPFKLTINDSFYISDITSADQPAYIEHFKEKQIYDQTLAIPFPYTKVDAERWIALVTEDTQTQGRSVRWAIRNRPGLLIGGIGFDGYRLGKFHKAEVGYWLAKPYWNQGIMTEAVKRVTEFGFREFGLLKITANVFDFNVGSARVLEKAGFELEGVLRKHYNKEGRIFDGKFYAKFA